jgi:hypothetical protein
MVLAGIYVRRDGNGLLCFEGGASGGDGIVFVEDPRVHGLVLRLFLPLVMAFVRFGAVGVMVEVVMNLDIVGPQFRIVLEEVIEEDGPAAGIHLAVERCRGLTDGKDFRQACVFIGTAGTKGAQ